MTVTIDTILKSVHLSSPVTCKLDGEAVDLDSFVSHFSPHLAAADDATRSVAGLTFLIYSRFFSRFDFLAYARRGAPAGDLTALLQQHNRGVRESQRGWIVQEVLPERGLFATRGGIKRYLTFDEVTNLENTAFSPAPGQEVITTFQAEQLTFQREFYHAMYLPEEDHSDQKRLVRVYWNVDVAGACKLMERVSSEFRRLRLPYRLKIANSIHLFERLDHAVLFFPQRFYSIASQFVTETARMLDEHLSAPIPVMTKQLSRGVSLAEDPGTGESFGASRSQLLAETIYAAYKTKTKGLDAQRRIFFDKLRERGGSENFLFLARSQRDIYTVLP